MESKNDTVKGQLEGLAHDEIAARAYHLWEERGSPVGSPEADWFRAEQEIRGEMAKPPEMGEKLEAKVLRTRSARTQRGSAPGAAQTPAAQL